MAVTTKDNPEEHQFEIYVDDALAGFTVYRSRPGLRAFIHTEIDPAFKGQGLGGHLITAALDAAGQADESVLPFCPFVNHFIKTHDEYLELVPEDQRGRFGLG
ncbi:MAG: N-acetyltransferase [Solirubrobacterales bacterium]|nr:N-acetyltransferase [Solirubrobacterales bacterium]